MNFVAAISRLMFMQPSGSSNSPTQPAGCSPSFVWGIAFFAILCPVVFMGYAVFRGKPMPVWEYKVEDITDPSLSDRLNLLGKQGWELVQANRTDESGTVQAGYEVILKRVK